MLICIYEHKFCESGMSYEWVWVGLDNGAGW